MPEAIQTTGPEEEPQEIDTDAEFKALYAESEEGVARLKKLAAVARETGKPDIAAVYDEMHGTVLSLVTDLIASTGGALVSLEDEVAEGEAQHEDSQLLPDDAAKYLLLFEQYMKLLGELSSVIPSGSEGDAQREIFATLSRMTEGLAAFTREITIGGVADDELEEEEESPESE
jgi:hypothetical protein